MTTFRNLSILASLLPWAVTVGQIPGSIQPPAMPKAGCVVISEMRPPHSPVMVSRMERPMHQKNIAIVTSGVVSPLGTGGRTVVNLRQSEELFTQFSTGYLPVSVGTRNNIAGANILGSVVPVFLGVKYHLTETRTSLFTWTQYAVAGGGPLVGLEYPNVSGFWDGMSKLGVRWGGGAYAGLGSEVRFTAGFGAFMQLELDAFGFLAQHLGRSSFLGPSFSFGIQFGL